MARHYCKIHGWYSDYLGGGCLGCHGDQIRSEKAANDLKEQLAELSEATSDAAQEAADAAEEAAYRTNNPGDYQCPGCRMVSLKRLARRCPLCQWDIPNDSWERISEEERIEKERRQEKERIEKERRQRAEEERRKWLASPEYAAQQERARREAEAQRKQVEALAREKKGKSNAIAALLCWLIPCVGPFITIVLAHMALHNLKGTKAKGHRVLAICLLVLIYGAIGLLIV